MMMKDKTYTFFYSAKQDDVSIGLLFDGHGFASSVTEVLVDGKWVVYTEMRRGFHLKNNWDDCMVVHVSDDYQLRINGIQ